MSHVDDEGHGHDVGDPIIMLKCAGVHVDPAAETASKLRLRQDETTPYLRCMRLCCKLQSNLAAKQSNAKGSWFL